MNTPTLLFAVSNTALYNSMHYVIVKRKIWCLRQQQGDNDVVIAYRRSYRLRLKDCFQATVLGRVRTKLTQNVLGNVCAVKLGGW